MKVLRQGTKNQVECRGCGSLLQYTPTDIRLVHAPVQAGPYDVETMPEREDHYRAQVTCPECKNSVPVPMERQQKRALLSARDVSDYDL